MLVNTLTVRLKNLPEWHYNLGLASICGNDAEHLIIMEGSNVRLGFQPVAMLDTSSQANMASIRHFASSEEGVVFMSLQVSRRDTNTVTTRSSKGMIIGICEIAMSVVW